MQKPRSKFQKQVSFKNSSAGYKTVLSYLRCISHCQIHVHPERFPTYTLTHSYKLTHLHTRVLSGHMCHLHSHIQHTHRLIHSVYTHPHTHTKHVHTHTKSWTLSHKLTHIPAHRHTHIFSHTLINSAHIFTPNTCIMLRPAQVSHLKSMPPRFDPYLQHPLQRRLCRASQEPAPSFRVYIGPPGAQLLNCIWRALTLCNLLLPRICVSFTEKVWFISQKCSSLR